MLVSGYSPGPGRRTDTSQILKDNDLSSFGTKNQGWYKETADKVVQYMRLLYEDVPADGDDRADPPPAPMIEYSDDGWPQLPELEPSTGQPIIRKEKRKQYLLAYFKALYGERLG